jgi:hypothetical protein
MPNTVTFSYTIAGAGRGGKLVPTGRQATPTLNSGDALQVQVRWAGSSPPVLQSYMVITPLKDSNQTLASPFRDTAHQRFACLMTTPPGSADAGGLYTFPVATYTDPNKTLVGKFELTVVIADVASDTMWSADPEFDTGG